MDPNWLAKIKELSSFHSVEIDECIPRSTIYFSFFFFFFGNAQYFLLREFLRFSSRGIASSSRVWNENTFQRFSTIVDEEEVVIFEIIGKFKVFLIS